MRQISIIFSTHKGRNTFSFLIRKGLQTPFSHVAIKMTDSETDQIMYYQASGLAINCVGEDEFLNKEIIIYQKDIQASDKVYIAGKIFINNQLGKPYGVKAILGFALQILLSKIGIHINNPCKVDGSEYVCSQLGAAYVEAADNIDLDIRNMTPLAFYNAMPVLPDVWE